MPINAHQAYVLGLFIGGGVVTADTFEIVLPFDKWGADAIRMNQIARNILTDLKDTFNHAYGINVDYDLRKKSWVLHPIDPPDMTRIRADLLELGLPNIGQLLTSADLEVCKTRLRVDIAGSLLSGIFDSRASLTKSHRRFTDRAPVVSIEIPGKTENFRFVMQLCSWLTDLGTITDQILYNHPSMHSPENPEYKGWKKGFKIRFLVNSFLQQHSFAMRVKAHEIGDLAANQTIRQQVPCPRRTPSPHRVCIHRDIKSEDLPRAVRGKLFFHYHHICAALGCPHAPVEAVRRMTRRANKLIHVFPICLKGGSEMPAVFHKLTRQYYFGRPASTNGMDVRTALDTYTKDQYIAIETAIAYLFSPSLKGKRHTGPQDPIVRANLARSVSVTVVENVQDSPVLLSNPRNGREVIVSRVNQKLLDGIISLHGMDVCVK